MTILPEQLEFLRYPIGRFQRPDRIDKDRIDQWIKQIGLLPEKLRMLVKDLSTEQLDAPYRPDGWTVRQVIHHLADSHINSYVRFKWTLTEAKPVIKAYDEQAWANLFDSRSEPVELSLAFLEALHAKWVCLLKGLSDKDLEKSFIHPATGKEVSLDVNIGLYAWHGEHHYAHIKNFLERER